MSDYESHSGIIHRIPRNEGETLDEQKRRIGATRNKPEDYDEDEFKEEFDEEVLELNDELWYLMNHEKHEHGDSIVRMYPNSDGSISFYTHYYNGGTYLNEMLEDGLGDLTK